MTPQDRMQQFEALLQAAQAQTGITLEVVPQTRSYGSMIQVEYTLTAVPVAGWQAPESSSANTIPDD